jgi:hypothetical protein
MNKYGLVFLLIGLAVPNSRASQTTDYRYAIMQQFVAADPKFAKFPVEFRFSAPNYAFVTEFMHPDAKVVCRIVAFDFAYGDAAKYGFSLKGSGYAIIEGTKITMLDQSTREIEWIFGKPMRDPKVFYSSFDTSRYSNLSLLKSLPNQQSTDPTP